MNYKDFKRYMDRYNDENKSQSIRTAELRAEAAALAAKQRAQSDYTPFFPTADEAIQYQSSTIERLDPTERIEYTGFFGLTPRRYIVIDGKRYYKD